MRYSQTRTPLHHALSEEGMNKQSKHTWVVDVVADGSASVEIDGRVVTPLPEWMLPEGAREGDVLSVTHTKKEGKSSLVIEKIRS